MINKTRCPIRRPRKYLPITESQMPSASHEDRFLGSLPKVSHRQVLRFGNWLQICKKPWSVYRSFLPCELFSVHRNFTSWNSSDIVRCPYLLIFCNHFLALSNTDTIIVNSLIILERLSPAIHFERIFLSSKLQHPFLFHHLPIHL